MTKDKMPDLTKVVVWPRGIKNGKYVYNIIGTIVVDEPIPGLEGNEYVCSSGTAVTGMIATALEMTHKKEPEFRLGDATDVLLSLKDL